MLKILSWNVAYRVKKQPDQLEAVISRVADLVGLQEITSRTLPIWVDALHESGYPHILSTFDLQGTVTSWSVRGGMA